MSTFSFSTIDDGWGGQRADTAAKDREALRAARAKKRPLYEKMEKRKEAVTKEHKDRMLRETGIKARKYGLKAPNNKEAIEYERTHCVSCGARNHEADAYEDLGFDYLGLLAKLGQQSVGMLCCGCFNQVKKSKKKVTIEKCEEGDRVWQEVYDPESCTMVQKCSPSIKFNVKQGDEVDRETTIDSVIRGSYNSRYGF